MLTQHQQTSNSLSVSSVLIVLGFDVAWYIQGLSCMLLSLNQLGNSAQSTQAKFGNGTSILYIHILYIHTYIYYIHIYSKNRVPKAHCKFSHCKYVQWKYGESAVKPLFPSSTSAPVLMFNYCPKCSRSAVYSWLTGQMNTVFYCVPMSTVNISSFIANRKVYLPSWLNQPFCWNSLNDN